MVGHDTRYPRVTWRRSIAAQPDVILLPSEPFAFDESHVPIFAALDVPAAHNGRIYLVDGSLLTWHGTRMARAFDRLPALLTEGQVRCLKPDDWTEIISICSPTN